MGFLQNFFTNRRMKKLQKDSNQPVSVRKSYLLDETTPFAVTEAFRNLKASLSVAVPKKDNGAGVSFLVTSTFPLEGKTTITVNLAAMFAESQVKVVLIDADIRKGRVAKYFKQSSTPGLSDYLSGRATLDEVLHQSEKNPNLYTIYHGTHSPRSYELLESGAMRKLSEELEARFDYVIYDTPPIQIVSDALALVPLTDGTLLVCRHFYSYMGDMKKSLDTLRFAKANVLGVVVNDFYADPKKLKGNKKYYYSTYYHYGENAGKESEDEFAE